MDQNVACVFRGYTRLNDEQQDELVKAINDYNKQSVKEQEQRRHWLEKSVGRVILGPVGGACTCCGR